MNDGRGKEYHNFIAVLISPSLLLIAAPIAIVFRYSSPSDFCYNENDSVAKKGQSPCTGYIAKADMNHLSRILTDRFETLPRGNLICQEILKILE